MIGRTLRTVGFALVGLGLVTACDASNRPNELSMDDVKPCELISEHALQQLQVKAAPEPLSSPGGLDEEGAACRYRPLTHQLVTISKVTNHGIDRWTSGSFNGATFEEVAPIRGFPTIKVGRERERSGPHTGCALYTDVADDRSLKVDVSENHSEDQPVTCDTARQFADAAMKTLVGSG
ncbi:DUF3558 family protein [Amycolatopsis cihanbeyliensis]|uniref:Uncharacterized protein DUF3558 n=1 Tax=Amycolatopsis cihanbeyliensis TaxID=1128664 RepID=A0A542DNT9_AMYCI|nr:DUF3558 family protein [Amycolatopsis cihanbeyliensis]TQJ04760.1 uncharacterized protein DUF3558 [Amycolatopsis cihanbeyliensis]